MSLGLLSGELLKSDAAPISKMRTLLVRGAICVLLGIILGHTCCPLVKRIWTPSWAIYSGGIATLILAAFYWIVDIRNLRSWSRPLQIVGTNSIAIYLAAQLLTPWIRATAKTYLGTSLFSGTYGIVTERSVTLAALWLMCFYLHRNRFFIRI
jgi:predicted acyltransferase